MATTADTTRVPSPVSQGHSPEKVGTAEKGANVPTHVAPGMHEAHASAPGANSVELTDEEKRLAQMPTGLRLYLIMLGLMLAVYVVSLDQTIVAPAIPIISNRFNALADVGWYASAYFATSTALQPLYGRLYRLNLKWPFISCIVIFEVGSIICAAAQDSKTFIVGRAIAGVGLAGGYIGVLTIIAASVPIEKVPVWSGVVGAVYGVGAITGPLIGGVFTTEVTWRWCFWLSLPLGGVTLATVLLFFNPPKRERPAQSFLQLLVSLDLVGTAIILGALICYLLALQDGGLAYEWSSSREIGLLVGFGVLLIVFFANEWWMGENAIIPLKILFTRTIGWAAICNLGIGGSYFTTAIYLPIYFQLLGSSSIRSGVQMLPLVCGVIFSVSISGGAAPAAGYVQPFLYFGTVVGTVGAGLFQLLDEGTSQPEWIGYTFLYGIGLGSAFQMPFIISQTFGKGLQTETGSSIVIFFQTLGGCLVVAMSQSIYANVFKNEIMKITAAGLDQEAIIAAGATGFRSFVPADVLPLVVSAAMFAISRAFIPAVVFIGLSLVTALPLPWASIKGMQTAGGA